MARSLLQRLFPSAQQVSPPTEVRADPVRLLDPSAVKVLPVKSKKSSLGLLPAGAYGSNYVFFSPDGGRTFLDLSDGMTVVAFSAYWYVATRWRAQKLAEAPLMVVKEDQDTGNEEWIPDHELVPVLELPSDDYDMGELIETTSHYLDNTGAAIWVKDTDRTGTVRRLTPFSRLEFETRKDDTRLFAFFDVTTGSGSQTFPAEEVCFFRDNYSTQMYGMWGRGRSRLDVALSWLRLGDRAIKTVHELLNNSVWPSGILAPDKEWNPDEETYEAYKQDLAKYASDGNKGKPFVALGGATFTALQAQIKNLVPQDILNRVEAVVSAVSGVPAIVLQFQVGLENSPWSQMGQARRMAYDDVIIPSWRKMERVTTRQLLRPVDEDPTHFLRFDKSKIDSLQVDRLQAAQIASMMGRAATLNERRAQMGLEPATKKQDPDGRADDIPELTTPSIDQLLAGGAPPKPGEAPPKPEETPPPTKALVIPERKRQASVLQQALRQEAIPTWHVHVKQLLARDAEEIASIVEQFLSEPGEKSREMKARNKTRVMGAVDAYLKNEGAAAWKRSLGPLEVRGAERSMAVVSASLGISFNLLHSNTIKFAQKSTGRLITNVSDTTRSLVSDIIQGGLDASASVKQIAQLIRDATGFGDTRAMLVARTETTQIYNGAPQEALADFGRANDKVFTKTWSGALDDRERDEHLEMEGETVPIDEPFSNGLQYPSEPNCRCTAIFNEAEG